MRSKRSTPKMLHRAWELRQDLTPAETKLWPYLRTLREQGVHFRRQHAIGPYITDFCAPGRHLVIELDGDRHTHQTEQDGERTAYLTKQGYRVIRFWNGQILNDIQAVIRTVEKELSGE